jgi:NADH-quinone oxidoreductase subunit A
LAGRGGKNHHETRRDPVRGAHFPLEPVRTPVDSSRVTSAYLPFLIQILLAAVITIVVIALSHLVGQRARGSRIKDAAYECGIHSDGSTHTRFSVKFYVTAMLFILFDIEVVFLIPWTFVYRDFLANNISILAPMMFFLGVLVLGLFYEVKKGALEWEK